MGVTALLTASLASSLTGTSSTAAATGTEADAGAWSAPFDLGGISIHAGLMHTGEVLYFQYVEGKLTTDHTSFIKTWDYQTGFSQLAPISYDRDLFCAGMTILPDGRMYISGGHADNTGKRTDAVGTNATDTFDPATRTWTPGPAMVRPRWYPTAVGMPNGHTYIFGGGERSGLPTNTVEDYDPNGGGTNGTMTTLPSTATKNLGWYPHMHLLADGRVVRNASSARTTYFKPSTNTWANGPLTTFGTRDSGASVLLPGGTTVLMFGGHSTATGPATASSEILDTSASTPAWRPTGPLNTARIYHNAVVLPDGKVLAIGGGAGPGKYTGPVMTAEMFDPVTETWTNMATQSVQRMYHSTALLLPDGRVLSSGSDSGTQSKTGEIYSPPYLFRGSRPVITSAPDSVTYGQPMSITTDTDIAKLVLIHPGAVTHQVDTDQRSVPLQFTGSAGTYTADSPGNSSSAPPGYYMLFAVDADGVPSVATWVKVS